MSLIKIGKELNEKPLQDNDRFEDDMKNDDTYKNRKERSEDLSFCELEKLMKQGHIYRRNKGGALKQIR